MRVGAWAPGPHVRLVLASVFDELLQVGGVGRLTGDEWQMSYRHAGNKHEILVGVVWQTLKEHAALCQRRSDGDQQRVTIRRRLLHGCSADRTAGTRLILNNNRLAE